MQSQQRDLLGQDSGLRYTVARKLLGGTLFYWSYFSPNTVLQQSLSVLSGAMGRATVTIF